MSELGRDVWLLALQQKTVRLEGGVVFVSTLLSCE
jgi:hypothetical protein